MTGKQPFQSSWLVISGGRVAEKKKGDRADAFSQSNERYTEPRKTQAPQQARAYLWLSLWTLAPDPSIYLFRSCRSIADTRM